MQDISTTSEPFNLSKNIDYISSKNFHLLINLLVTVSSNISKKTDLKDKHNK